MFQTECINYASEFKYACTSHPHNLYLEIASESGILNLLIIIIILFTISLYYMKVKNKIKIKLNGKKIQINNNETLNKLVKRLNLPLNKVALELNKKIIDKKKLNLIKLNNNDTIEVVHFIGGG